MASVTLDITEFREIYPAFSDNTKYPDSVITIAFNKATIFFKNETNCVLDEGQLKTIEYLMTAHLLQIQTNTNSGNTAGVITSASIDKISVTIADPSSKDDFDYFLNQTIYGQELLALLSLLVVGGFYIGGSPETMAIKRQGNF